MLFKAVTLILTVCVLFIFSEVRAQEKVDFAEAEQLQLSYDFGLAKEGDMVNHTFEILNNSQFVWQVRSILPSCECVSANLAGKDEGAGNINPGETFQVEVKLNTAGYKGTVEQFVYLNITQENESKILKLVIEGESNQRVSGKALERLLEQSGIRSLSKEAAAFSLPDIDGNDVSLGDYKGKVVLLNFWTTWCPNCANERSSLEKLYQKFKNDDFILLAVNLKEPKDIVKKFIAGHNLNYLHLLDVKNKAAEKYNVRFLPDSFIIDKEGWVVGEAMGLRHWAEKPIIALFEYLIKE